MTVANLLRDKGNAIYTIEGVRMLADGAKMLSERKVGALVVLEEGVSVAGILGEREIVGAIAAHGASVLMEPVRDHMITKFVTCRRSDSIGHLMSVMTNSRLRHVPVMDKGQLIGVVSIGDVVKHRIAETEHEAETLREFITAR